MLQVKNLTGGYEKTRPAVQKVSFNVEKGMFFALLGPNGSGKTTLTRLIMGAMPLTQGEVLIAGKLITKYSTIELARKVSVLTQETQSGLDFTVEEIVALGRYPYQANRIFQEETKADKQTIQEAMELTNVWKYRKKPFLSLSGGEKQRVLLAKALAQEPELIILDEPTNHLDIKHTIEILDLLKKLQAEKNLTVLAILHDLNVASLYADFVGVLDKGELVHLSRGFQKHDQQLLTNVYETELKITSHTELPKPQITYMPNLPSLGYQKNLKPFSLTQTDQYLELNTSSSLRTLFLGEEGEGLTWCDGIIYQHAAVTTNRDRNKIIQSSINLSDSTYQEQIITGYHCMLIKTLTGTEINLAFFTEFPLTDLDLMNVAMSLQVLRVYDQSGFAGGHSVVGTQKEKGGYITEEARQSILKEMHLWIQNAKHLVKA